MKKHGIDKMFFGIVLTLIIIGAIMFTSASLGILANNENKFYSVLFSQFVLGFVGGLIAIIIAMKIPYKFWRQYSLFIFILSILLTALVYVPHLGSYHGGARRWVAIGRVSFQPVEFLKIGFVMFFAAWLSALKGKINNWKVLLLPVILFGISAVLLLKQPDTKSIILMLVTAITMLFVSGLEWKYILSFFGICLVGFMILVAFKPYLRDRVATFLHPNQNGSSSSYQLQQSFIAVGSGGVFGRGLGQSIQKFNYLPEPQGDSIFAVIGEELGFLGGVVLICLFVAFSLRGYRIAYHSPDSFAKLLVIGLVTMITAQSFMNIASIIGVFPLTGVPLVFISQGGTALLLAIGTVGIIFNISKYTKK